MDRADARSSKRSRRRLVVGTVSVTLGLLLACVAWVGVRAWLAKGELEAAVPWAMAVQSAIGEANPDAALDASTRLVDRTESAVALTGDPIWRAAEVVPVVGANLAAVRVLSEELHAVSSGAIEPLAELAGSLESSSFRPVGGAIDLEPLREAAPVAKDAARVVSASSVRVDQIDRASLIGPVADAADRLGNALEQADSLTDALASATHLLPSMLGLDGPRDYVILFQNNAELRTAGGIPGALAKIHAEAGAITLVDQVSTSAFPRGAMTSQTVPASTTQIFGTTAGQFIQNVTMDPDFSTAGALAAEFWTAQRGGTVDGVIAVDPVGMSYLLAATGPVTLANGDELTADNAVQNLLVDVYSRFPGEAAQDDYFASASGAVFSALTNGNADAGSLLRALARAGDEHRIALWSAHDDEQAVLASTTLGGLLSAQKLLGPEGYGVYLNDTTGAKMDAYLDVSVGQTATVEREDGRADVAIEVTLTSTAPADAAALLPERVTAAGYYGVPAGSIGTNITVYAPDGAFDGGVTRDGASVGYASVPLGTQVVNTAPVVLAPGESVTLTFHFISASPGEVDPVIVTTPLMTGLGAA
ncbi:DUF4012 domain-containing protein [Agromyces atrinae]|uniref:DUF4012 domain-containing protein n=1 Tax=Agromyces atrinae TaxID=592376 RepID=A0A4Q2M6N7_9MICO|nr:DUF4012 domain-containing protein [Agromyces atrinae]NYD68538.1 hypothetical protein [Agromyces atrinae]RXZ85923.1 DUF4012 domain-containing protein [Agromyces atrinae]